MWHISGHTQFSVFQTIPYPEFLDAVVKKDKMKKNNKLDWKRFKLHDYRRLSKISELEKGAGHTLMIWVEWMMSLLIWSVNLKQL